MTAPPDGETGDQGFVERASVAGEDEGHRQRDRCACREKGSSLPFDPAAGRPPIARSMR